MKHSAKAAARQAREQARRARRGGGDASAGPGAAPDSGRVPGDSLAPAAPGAAGSSGGGVAASAAGPRRGLADDAAAPIAGRQWLAQLPYALVAVGIVLGLALMWIAGQAVRSGTLVIACALLGGSVARLVLPASRVGLLGSRRRLVDVAMLTALGVGLLVAGLIVQVPG